MAPIKLITDLSTTFTILKFPPDFQILPLLQTHEATITWYTLSKTSDEISLIFTSTNPETSNILASSASSSQPDWVSFKIDGVLDFSLVGILAQVVEPLKQASIPVFVISTFDTDYIFVRTHFAAQAISVLTNANIKVQSPTSQAN